MTIISEEIKKSINNWAKERDKQDFEALAFLAIQYIEENQIDWNTINGKKKVIYNVEKLSYGISHQNSSFNDNWIDHQSNDNPFEVALDEVFSDDIDENIKNDISSLKINKPAVPSINFKVSESKNKVEILPFPFEIKELLWELDDNGYKSHYLTNYTTQGRIKLIRKAKILAFLYKSKNTN